MTRKLFGNALCCLLSSLVLLLCISLPCQADAVAYWTFDDSNAIEYDAVPTDNGASSTDVGYSASGMFGGAADFATSSDDYYITLGNASDFDSTEGYAVSVWYNSNNNTIDDGLKVLHITAGSPLGTALTISSDGNIQPFIRDPSGQKIELTSTATVTDSAWHNIAYVYDPTTQTMNGYVDGILDCTGSNANIGTVSGFTLGKLGVHATMSGHQNLCGLLDDMVVMTNTISDVDVALINGLGRLADVSINNYLEMEAVKAAFAAGPGNSAVAGGLTWEYAGGLGSTTVGTIGGSAATGDAFIVLDSAGNGVMLAAEVPEPGTIALLVTGLLGLIVCARHKR